MNTLVHRSPFTVHRSPFTVHRSPFTVHRSPFTVHRSPFTGHGQVNPVWYGLQPALHWLCIFPDRVMDQHLTVKEATQLTGKSESTIKRFLREITADSEHADRNGILPPHAEVERRREAGEPYIWKIDKTILLKRFPAEGESSASSTDKAKTDGATEIPHSAIRDVLQQHLQSKDQQLATLEKQLDRKDEQIQNLNERMRESNVLMKELQQRLAITAPAPKPDTPRSSIDAEMTTLPTQPSNADAQSASAKKTRSVAKHLPTFAGWWRKKK